MSISIELFNGPLSGEFEKLSEQVRQNNIVSRIFDRDFSIWSHNPNEILNRLDWLTAPVEMQEKIPEILNFVEEVRRDGIEKALLLGMGGSSLAPEVFVTTFGTKPNFIELEILDSTVPESITEKTTYFEPEKTLFITSTKSGNTVETISLFNFFYQLSVDRLGAKNTGKHFVAITDHDSDLSRLAQKKGFRRTFNNNPNIGGRYSALSHFGLVPAALIGCDIESLLHQAKIESNNTNPAIDLGVFLGAAIAQGRDKMTLIASPDISPLGVWIEQLIAESTGKDLTGILPINEEPILPINSYGNDRFFVYLRSDDSADVYAHNLISAGYPLLKFRLDKITELAGAMYQWELATAIVGYLMKIHPFNQPDVEAAKARAQDLIKERQKKSNFTNTISSPTARYSQLSDIDNIANINSALEWLIAHGNTTRSYVAIQAYLHPSLETQELLKLLRIQLQKVSGSATTIGYGPRYLHSTGQLHKGDAGHGLFLQIIADTRSDVEIPNYDTNNNESLSFGTLAKAQAQGDAQILNSKGRYVLQINLGADVIFGLKKIIQVLNKKTWSDVSEPNSQQKEKK